MLAIGAFMSLAKIMLILNGLNVTASKVVASPKVNTGGPHELTIMQNESNINEDVSVGGIDFLNIRHERSKHRRHTFTEKEQQLQPHLTSKLYESRPNHKVLHLPHANNDQKVTAVKSIDDYVSQDEQKDEMTKPEIHKFSHNVHSTKGYNINIDPIDASDANVVGNVTSYLNNANANQGTGNSNDMDTIADTSNIYNNLQATMASHYLATSTLETTTALTAVTHKIRKLHKKKIVESLRQLNIDKLNTNGGHLAKNHHRSLLAAEHWQQQQQHAQLNIRIPHTPGDNQQSQQQQKQQQTTTDASINANSSHIVDKASNSNEATHDIDTNESGNDGDLNHKMDEDVTDNDQTIDNDNNNNDADKIKQDNNNSLSNVFYQNDENKSNGSDEEAVDVDVDDDIDVLYATTFKSTLDNKFDKQFKNFSSEVIKDIDNNVDLDDNETESENETLLTAWQQVKNLKFKPLNLSNSSKTYFNARIKNLLNNLTEDLFLNNTSSVSKFPFDLNFSTEYHSLEPLLSASTSQGKSLFDAKEEINFNDSSSDDDDDDDSSSSFNDLIMDEAVSDNDVNDGQEHGFSLSELDEADPDSATETEGTAEVVAGDDDTNHFLEGVVDAANSKEIYDWDEISRSNRRDLMHGRDVVTKFLQIVETQHSLGSNCEAGTSLNLGEGVVDRYAQDRFRVEAEVAVNRANMLTRIFKMTSAAAQADVNLLHASVLSMVEFDDDIFAAGNCFDWNEHPSQPGLFCPFAYRLPPPNLGAILAKDLSMEYHYLGNTSEWFFQARKNAEKVIARNEQYLKAFHLYSNKTDERIEDDTLAVKYEDGRWSKPYYDCGGGNIWMLTYTVPFFGYENSTYHFKGTSGIDIDLRRVDIDQCPQRNIPGSTKPLNIFAGTDKCKQRTTMCEAIQGLGFRRGSYKCVCRKGYYFPDTTSQHKYFNGSLLEEEYEKLMLGKNSTYNIANEYECLPCAEGCDSCEDGSPCIAALNWPMRSSILALACVVIGLLPPAAWFTFRYQQVKVVRAASPALLRVIALGAFFIYCTNIVMYPNPNLYTCTARIWLREIGFSLTYGALMLKTWRISVIFRVRSAKAVKITDAALLKRLGCICGAIGTCLLVRTLVSPPDVVVGRTADDLKAFLCKTDWWDYTFTSMEVVFLAWGVRLCIMVRKAPSEFNESRFISMAIYNEFLLTCFLNVSMLFLQSPANPDLLYIIFFCHTQLTITLLLALIFGSKVYIVLRSGKSHQENIGMGAKSSGAKFNFRPQVRTFANPSSVTTSTAPVAATTSAEIKLSEQEALEEIRQLSLQLQRIQEMAPPKGVAVLTISSLLDGLKTPTSMVMASAAATQGAASGLGGNQLTVRPQKPEALPLLSLNAEMQKYQQLQMPQRTSTAATTMMLTTTTNNNVAIMKKSLPAITLPSTPASVTTPAFTKGIIATGRWEEKSVNTEIVGNCIAEEKYKQQQQQQQHLHEHIVCYRCYEKCKTQQHHKISTAKVDKCQMLGSPQPEGSISFKNIKLDCMCSQADDLDQLAEREQHQPTIKRITKRTAATNTPPSAMRKHTGHTSLQQQPARDVKALSSVSLPSDESQSRDLQKPISYLSPEQQEKKQQICDSCKNKFKRKESFRQTAAAGRELQKQKQQQLEHRKLSRLSNKCKKLVTDTERSKQTVLATTKATTSYSTSTKPQQQQQQQQQKSCDCAEYSTDDIIFYTTTDTSDNDDDDDETDDDENSNIDEDLSSYLSHSKSETRVPMKLKPHLATIELKCISLSLGNITTTSAVTGTTSQPESINSKNALLESNTTTIQVTTSKLNPSNATSTSLQTQTQQQSATPPPATAIAAATPTNSSNGSNNGKAKRPDKLILNLNDRSKFTKEVSV